MSRLDMGARALGRLGLVARWSMVLTLCACGGTDAADGSNAESPNAESPNAESPNAESPNAESPNAPNAGPSNAGPSNAGPSSVGPVDASAVASRVEAARARLQRSEAGQLVWQSIEAHGGLETWLRQGTLAFDFDYRPLGQPERVMHTRQRVDIRSARAVHEEVGDGADARFGWDGERAWIAPGPDAFPSTARFWSLTPYYFLGMPFVLGDPGVQLEQLPDQEVDGERYQLVRVTYESGTGDSPDDYYVVYLHPRTHRLAMLRYVVSYPGFFSDGGHTPEKLMRYTEPHTVGGLELAQRLDTFAWDAETQTPGDLVTEIVVSDVSLGDPILVSDFSPPEGASVSTEIESRPR